MSGRYPVPLQRWVWLASVHGVIDAETIEVVVDQGFGGRQVVAIRLRGVSVPGWSEGWGEDAYSWVWSWLTSASAHGVIDWPLVVETFGVLPGSCRRTSASYEGMVWRADDCRCLKGLERVASLAF